MQRITARPAPLQARWQNARSAPSLQVEAATLQQEEKDINAQTLLIFGVAVALAKDEFDKETLDLLMRIQNDLFDLGADLSNPLNEHYEYDPIRIEEAWIVDLENSIDKYNSGLGKLDSFILPGGSGLAAGLHLARTVVRRAERATWHAIEAYGTEPAKKGQPNGGINVAAAKYLNRLSDLLFVLARYANVKHGGDVKWVPSKSRSRG